MFVRLPLRDPARNQKWQPSMSNISDSSSPQGAGRPGVEQQLAWRMKKTKMNKAWGSKKNKASKKYYAGIPNPP